MDSVGDIDVDIHDDDNDDDDDDDDDDMLDLFSFGAEGATPAEPTDQPFKIHQPLYQAPSKNHPDAIGRMPTLNVSADRDQDDDASSHASNDSFIELLENAQHNEISILEDMNAVAITVNKKSNEILSGEFHKSDDSDMQDILDWLDDDDKKGKELLLRQEEDLRFVQPPRPQSLKDCVPKPDPISSPLKHAEFDTLEHAVMSSESSKSDIRRLLEKEKFAVGPEIRPHLWSKIICEKTLEETLRSSLADSFQQWEQDYWQNSTIEDKTDSLNEVTLQGTQENVSIDNASSENEKEDKERTLQQDCKNHGLVSHQMLPLNRQEKQIKWLEKQSGYLAERILTVVEDGDFRFYRKALQAILRNHFNTENATIETKSNEHDSSWKDPLIPPVLCVILSSGVPSPVACVMLSQIIPTFMPILALTTKERQATAMILHRQLYLLACYHLPLLVLHLDKFIPDWHKCYPHGKIPQSWLISHLAGETDGAFMDANCLLYLWDLVLTTENSSLRFFLVIAILDLHAERLLLLTDEDLKEELNRVLRFSWSFSSHHADTTVKHLPKEETKKREAIKWVQEWTNRATLLCNETPIAVTRKLRVLENEAVTKSLVARQEAKEEKLRLQQEAEDKALDEARELEKERNADEARKRLNRARLVAFYRQYNPGKENNIDKIMKTYEGRFEILDAKLKFKYGVSFNPALKPKPITISKNNSKIFSTMNSGFGQFKSISKNKKHQNINLQLERKESAVVQVPASEVISILCLSKDANRIKISKLNKDSKKVNNENGRIPLKFCIVDCRVDAATKEQGRLPASVVFCSESINDSKRIEEQEIFESLRGSVHICIMSEGYAALPQLYGHKMTSGLAELIREEDERNIACARFFLSKGFPFVSLLEGGFASAHAYLCREGPNNHLNVNDILIDYDPDVSLFGRFEKLHSMSSRDKAQRSLQSLFDSSMTALTKHSIRLDSLASESDNGVADEQTQQKGGPKNAVKRFFGGKNEGSIEDENSGSFKKLEAREDRKQRQTHGLFRDTFTRKMQTMRDGKGNSSIDGFRQSR